MQYRALYSIQEARKLLGGISRNTIYQLLRSGELASVIISRSRFMSAAAIRERITRSTTTVSPAPASTRSATQAPEAPAHTVTLRPLEPPAGPTTDALNQHAK